MALYFADTEITGVKDLFPLLSKDITNVYFADTELFTVWGEYDGILPAQYSANGDYLADYRVYGSAVGVGDRTENLLDYNDVTRVTVRGINFWGLSFNLAAGDYVCKAFAAGKDVYLYAAIKHSDGTYSDNYYIIVGGTNYSRRVSVSEGDVLYIFNAYTAGTRQQTISACKILQVMLTEGSTAPASYVPYGYAVPMSVSDGTTEVTTPIYIGDTPLGEDEYVDFSEQKVYRMNGGVLTPTDPPVPLPALPTVDGTNIVDYAGQSAAVPSRFVAKYRKEGFE